MAGLACIGVFVLTASLSAATRPLPALDASAGWTSSPDKVVVSEEAGRVALASGVNSGWGSNFLGGVFRGGLDELGLVRADVPGLQNPVRESYQPMDAPEPPYLFRGFELTVESSEAQEDPTVVWIGNFRAFDVDYKTYDFYAMFGGTTWYGDTPFEANDILRDRTLLSRSSRSA